MKEFLIKAGRYSATVLDQGAVLYSFKIDDTDIILEYDNKSQNEVRRGFFSQVVGPFANRIKAGEYVLNGIKYQTEKNNGNNGLHSGSRNYGYQVWSLVEKTESSVKLHLSSPEGYGFPGNHEVDVIYSISENGELTIHYSVVSDKACPVNITNHAFFNLNPYGTILDHVLTLPAHHYVAVDEELIPTEIKETKGTDFDFTAPRKIGEKMGGSYDHCFILDDPNNKTITVTNGKLTLTTKTDLPSVQLYTSGTLDRGFIGKGGTELGKNMAFCLETEFYPDFPNRPEFEGHYLEPGVKYETETTYTLTEN